MADFQDEEGLFSVPSVPRRRNNTKIRYNSNKQRSRSAPRNEAPASNYVKPTVHDNVENSQVPSIPPSYHSNSIKASSEEKLSLETTSTVYDNIGDISHGLHRASKANNISMEKASAASNSSVKSREAESSAGSTQSKEKEYAYNPQFLPNHLQMHHKTVQGSGEVKKRNKKGIFGKLFSNQVQADFDDFQLLELQSEGSQGFRSGKASELSECYGIDRGDGMEEFSSGSRAQITRSRSGSVQSSLSSESNSKEFAIMSNMRILSNRFQAGLALKDKEIEYSRDSSGRRNSHRDDMNFETSNLNDSVQPDFGPDDSDVHRSKSRNRSFKSNRSNKSNASNRTTDSKLKLSSKNIDADFQHEYVDDTSRKSGSDSIQSRSSNEQAPSNSNRKRSSKLKIFSNHVQADYDLEKDENQSQESATKSLSPMTEAKPETRKLSDSKTPR